MTTIEPLNPTQEFLDAAAAAGLEFEPGDLERLGRFLAMLLETNKTTNLTAITDPAHAWMKHIFDALTLLPIIAGLGADEDEARDDRPAPAAGPSVVDVGSGGGVPALPLAIVMPGVRFTLVEATGKKATFLREAARVLGLENARVVNSRAEQVGHDRTHRERYDAALARALGHLAVVLELTVPLVRVGGVVLAVKGAKAQEELDECERTLSMLGAAHDQTVPTPTGRIVVLSKVEPTPQAYPRRDGEPKAHPLGVKKDPRTT